MDLRRRLLYAIFLLLVITTLTVGGYRLLGGASITFLQALYMAVITLAGVGYGEIIDTSHNPALRVFNMFVVLVGVTITVYVFSLVTAFLVEGEMTNLFWRRKMQKRIKELKDHYIVCGLGDTGRYAVEELQKTGTPYMVIDANADKLTKFKEHHGDPYPEMLYLVGDATDEAVLDEAGIDRAKGLIAAIAGDKDNLVITVMVRQKSSKIRIVARCTNVKFAERMMKAGANSTVSPNQIGGLRMASEVIRPHVVGFLDLMLKEQSRTLRIEEIEIKAPSPWIGSSTEALHLRSQYNLLLLAVKNAEATMKFWVNPPESLVLNEGTVLIVMGDITDIRRARLEAQQAIGEPQTAAAHSA